MIDEQIRGLAAVADGRAHPISVMRPLFRASEPIDIFRKTGGRVEHCMNTDDLIALLAEDPAVVRRNEVGQQLALALAIGGAVTFAILLSWLGLRRDLAAAMDTPTIWLKWAYTVSLAVTALMAVRHLARPETRRSEGLLLLAAPVAILAVVAAVQVWQATPAAQAAMWLGASWRECSTRIIVLSVPIFATLVFAFRRFAPTRLRLTGAAIGVVSGGTAATIYGFACPETSAAFVLVWYSLGIAAAAAIGGALGPRLLKW